MILLTGGSGLLGTELQKHLRCWAPSHEEFDILRPSAIPEEVGMIVHCAAYTDVLKAETETDLCREVNVNGTRAMSNLEKSLVYISTEYVFDGFRGGYREEDEPNPINWYAQTKADGEYEAINAPESLIIRCLFKARPYPHARAPEDQWTTGDYVDVIAPMIARAILLRQFFAEHDVIHIGTERKSTYDLAMRSRDVDPCRRSDLAVRLPKDTTLNTDKWKSTLLDPSSATKSA